MFALLYLIFRRCAWMQYMKTGHSGTAGQGTSLSPCALKGQISAAKDIHTQVNVMGLNEVN